MPKRNCPFEDNLLPQLKVHVGKKQLDNGVSSDERMKDVYGKIHILRGYFCIIIQFYSYLLFKI